MNLDIDQTLRESVSEALQMLADAPADFATDGATLPENGSPLITATVYLTGADRAALTLYFSNKDAQGLFEKFAGYAEEDPVLLGDAVGELANLVAGGVKRIFAEGVDNPPYDHLSLPRISEGQPSTANAGAGTSTPFSFSSGNIFSAHGSLTLGVPVEESAADGKVMS